MKIQLTHRGRPIVTDHIGDLSDTALLNVSELCRRLRLSRQLFVLWVGQYGWDQAIQKALDRKAKREATLH